MSAVRRYFGPDARPVIVTLHDKRRGWTIPEGGRLPPYSAAAMRRYRRMGYDALGLAVPGPGRGVAEFATKDL